MADFTRWVLAAIPTFGWKPDKFLSAYKANRNLANITLAESDPAAHAIDIVVGAHLGEWEGTATELLGAFATCIGSDDQSYRYLPKLANTLGNKVRRLAPALTALNIEFEEYREGRAGTRKLRFRRRE